MSPFLQLFVGVTLDIHRFVVHLDVERIFPLTDITLEAHYVNIPILALVLLWPSSHFHGYSNRALLLALFDGL
jgi:hypothetical protein